MKLTRNLNLEKANEKDMEFVKSFKLNTIDNVYIIKEGLNDIGVVEYIKKQDESEECDSIYVEYIDVLEEYRRQGYATQIINMLLDDSKNCIYGNSLPNEVSVSFWQSFGADFEGEDDNLDYYAENNECIPFII